MRFFRSPNAGQTSLTLQHSTSPASGYRPPAGHNADGYTNGGDRVAMAKGGRAKKNWIQSVNKSINLNNHSSIHNVSSLPIGKGRSEVLNIKKL